MRIGTRTTVAGAMRGVERPRAMRGVESPRALSVDGIRSGYTGLASLVAPCATERISNRQWLARLETISNSLKTKARHDF